MSGLILKEASGSFTPAPDGGHSAVCVDVIDLGMVETSWEGEKRVTHKCRLVFEIAERMDDDRRYVVSRQFTASLNEKASLRKFLESWRGRPFTREELAGFNTEQLIGAPCVLQIVHVERAGKTYANIDSVMKLMKGVDRLTPSGDYIRVKDRAPKPVTQHDEPPPLDDEDFGVPF